MKTAETKTTSPAAVQRKAANQPFFQPEESRDSFFGGKQAEAEPFFKANAQTATVKAQPAKPIQAKLKIGAPDDFYERQADSVADSVVTKLSQPKPAPAAESPGKSSTSAPAVQAKCAACEQEDKLQKKEEEIDKMPEQVQRKPIFDSAGDPPPDDNIQRKPMFDSTADDIQAKCADCEEAEGTAQRQDEAGGSGGGESDASPDVSSRLSASKGGGSPLPDEVGSSMGEAMGADFSGVRIHTGSEAAGLSQSLGAQAFTHGNDIYFNEGKYNPGSSEGQRLLAHELTHTVQQGAALRRKPAEQEKQEATELTGEEPKPKAEGNGEQPQVPGPPPAVAEEKIEEIPGATDIQAKPEIAAATTAPRVQRGLWSSITSAVSSVAGSLDPRQWLNRAAMNIPGFRLVTVIIGYNPIIQQDVPRTAENFIGGFLGLLGPIGNALFAKLQETNAIQMALTWLDQEVTALGITLSYIGSLISRILGSISLTDISGSIGRALDILREPVSRIMRFLGRLADKIKEFIFRGALTLVGAPVDMVMGILSRAGNILKAIFENPIGFIGNLVNSIKTGLMNFMQNIGRHLINGVVNWLFGALQGAGIQLPSRWDLPGIFSLVMQILNLTYQQGVRPRLVRFLGETGVARLETAFEFIRDVMTRGPIAIWERIKEFLGNLKDMVMEGIKGFVVTRLVQAGITKLISMFNPAGALIQAVMAIWNTIKFFIERAQQIASFVNAVFESISNIASGAVGTAAQWIENALGRAIPVILGFLGRLIGLGNISEQIRNIIARVRAPIDAAIDRVVNWVVAQGRRLIGAVTGRGQEDTRSDAQKKTDLDNAIGEVNTLIGQNKPIEEVRTKLPTIKSKYNLVSLEIELIGSEEYDVIGKVNPERKSEKGKRKLTDAQIAKLASQLKEGSNITVSTFPDADAVLNVAFPGARKVQGAGPKSSQQVSRNKKDFKFREGEKGNNAVFHKDYLHNPDDADGSLYGHEELAVGHEHKTTPHINVLAPGGNKVVIFIEK